MLVTWICGVRGGDDNVPAREVKCWMSPGVKYRAWHGEVVSVDYWRRGVNPAGAVWTQVEAVLYERVTVKAGSTDGQYM